MLSMILKNYKISVKKEKKKAERKGIIQEIRFISLALAAVPVLAGEGLIATTLTASNKNLPLPPPSSVSFSVFLFLDRSSFVRLKSSDTSGCCCVIGIKFSRDSRTKKWITFPNYDAYYCTYHSLEF